MSTDKPVTRKYLIEVCERGTDVTLIGPLEKEYVMPNYSNASLFSEEDLKMIRERDARVLYLREIDDRVAKDEETEKLLYHPDGKKKDWYIDSVEL